MMRNTAIEIPLLLLCAFATKLSPSLASCVDLTTLITDETAGNLQQVTGGGNVSANVPLYFDVGRQQIDAVASETIFCLDDLKIPFMVGENVCADGSSCWLAVGMKANDVNAMDCVCSGLEWTDGGPVEDTIINGCGLSSPDQWGTTCTDTENGRNNPNEEYATVHITVCPAISGLSDCPVCSGGILPAFQVAVQWLPANCVSIGWPTSSSVHVRPSLIGAFGVSTLLLLLLETMLI